MVTRNATELEHDPLTRRELLHLLASVPSWAALAGVLAGLLLDWVMRRGRP